MTVAPAPRSPRNGLAVAALASCFALLGLAAPLGVVLGLVALVGILRARRAGGRPRGLVPAVAAIVLGCLFTVAWVGAVWFVVWAVQLGDRSERLSDPAAVTEPAEVYFTALSPGHCANFGHFGASRVTVLPCSQPHSWELLAMLPVQSGPGGSFPGEGAAYREGVAACERLVASLPPTATSSFRTVPLTPTERLWEEGFTEAWCFAEVRYGRVTGAIADDDIERVG